jgi:sigma-B regulation protein RsbU (phosphoserine phosphatase)
LLDYQVRPQAAAALLFGYLGGPGVGFLVGFAGNMIGDYLSGEGMLRFAASFSVCNGIYGLIMGLFGRKKRRFDNPEDIGALYVFMLFSVSAGTFYAMFVEVVFFGIDFATEFERLCLATIISSYLLSAMLVPFFLYATNRIRRTIVQRYTLFFYYFSFLLSISSVFFVLFLLSFRFNFDNSIINAHLFMYDFLIIPTLAVTVAGSIVSSGMIRKIASSLSKLNREIRRITEEGFTSRIKVNFPEDLREISASFNDMTDRLAVYAHEIQKIAGEKERIRTELYVASKIQKMLLPDCKEGETGGCEIFGWMAPMKEIGGDFFNYFPIDEDRFFFIVADVTGHGIPAALFMMETDAALKILVRTESDIERIFAILNAQLCERNSENYFVTAFAGIFSASSHRLRYIDAGHNPPYFKSNFKPRSDGFQPLPCQVNSILGGLENEEYKALEIVVEEGDVLYIYTDGVTEALNGDSEMYSAERLVQALNSAGDDPQTLMGRVFADMQKFTGDAEQSDDVTMLCIKFP